MFNGTYTIENTKTGNHRTFSIKTQSADAKFAPGSRVVALLTGPDNTADYQPFAFVTTDGLTVWKKKRGSFPVGGGAYQYSAWEYYAMMLLDLVERGQVSVWSKRGYAVRASTVCIQCNRKLTTPDSIKCGIGPDCAEKLGVDRADLVQAFDAAEQAASVAAGSDSPRPGSVPATKAGKVQPLPRTALQTPAKSKFKVKVAHPPAPVVDDTAYVQERRERERLERVAHVTRHQEKCERCRGTGVYGWGASVNGKMEHSGPCFRCEGKGFQTAEDERRNDYYDNHRTLSGFTGGADGPVDGYEEEHEFDEEIQRRDREDAERAAEYKAEREYTVQGGKKADRRESKENLKRHLERNLPSFGSDDSDPGWAEHTEMEG